MSEPIPGHVRVWAEHGRVWLQHEDEEEVGPLYSFDWERAQELARHFLEASAEAHLQQQKEAGFVHLATVYVDREPKP